MPHDQKWTPVDTFVEIEDVPESLDGWQPAEADVQALAEAAMEHDLAEDVRPAFEHGQWWLLSQFTTESWGVQVGVFPNGQHYLYPEEL